MNDDNNIKQLQSIIEDMNKSKNSMTFFGYAMLAYALLTPIAVYTGFFTGITALIMNGLSLLFMYTIGTAWGYFEGKRKAYREFAGMLLNTLSKSKTDDKGEGYESTNSL